MLPYRGVRRSGLTLIEVLLILALLIFLLAFLLPAVARVRTAAGQTQSFNNLKQLALALHSCEDAYKVLPPTVGKFGPRPPNNHGTLFFHILPWVAQDNFWKRAEGGVWNNGVYSTPVSVFVNPKDASAPPNNQYEGWLATSSYAANWMVFKEGGAAFARSFPDGTSNTIVLTERYQVCNGHPCGWGYAALYYWAPMFAYYSKAKFQLAPSQDRCDPGLAQATDRSGIQVGLGDGSVRLVADLISPQTWAYICDPADGNVLAADW